MCENLFFGNPSSSNENYYFLHQCSLLYLPTIVITNSLRIYNLEKGMQPRSLSSFTPPTFFSTTQSKFLVKQDCTRNFRMLSFWICSVVLYNMISDVLAFTSITGNQCSSSLGLRTETKIIKRSYTNSYSDSRSMADQCEQHFSRSLALPMATKLKYADDENSMTNTTVGLSSRVETLFPSTETLTIEMTEHVPLGCTVDESLHEEDDFIFISKLTTNGHAEEAGLQVGDVIVGVTGLFGELISTIDVDIEKL